MFSLAKRARKYNLGLTTVTQDVEDFMASRMGRAIVANSSMQILLKQSPSAVDVLADVFKLTSEETKRLSQFPIGQGLFFAGQNHVHIQVIASPTETSLITSNPGDNAPRAVDLGPLASPSIDALAPGLPTTPAASAEPVLPPIPTARSNVVLLPQPPARPETNQQPAAPQPTTSGEVRLSHEG